MDDYAAAVKTGRAAAPGWPAWINPPSKAGQAAAVSVRARELADEAARRDILVNAACPGLVDTDASRPWFDDTSGALSPDDAATDVLWPATLPPAPASPTANSSSTARSSPSHRRPSGSPREPASQAGQITNRSTGRFNGDPAATSPEPPSGCGIEDPADQPGSRAERRHCARHSSPRPIT